MHLLRTHMEYIKKRLSFAMLYRNRQIWQTPTFANPRPTSKTQYAPRLGSGNFFETIVINEKR